MDSQVALFQVLLFAPVKKKKRKKDGKTSDGRKQMKVQLTVPNALISSL